MNKLEAKKCEACGSVYDLSVVFCRQCGERLIVFDTIVGETLDGRYRIENVLGRGGMGVVYRATHVHIDSRVAVKILHPELVSDRLAIERFRREARAAGRIQHPNAVLVTDFGVTERGIVYLVMELVIGETMRSLLNKEKSLTPTRAVRLMRQVCAAVQAAHQNGVIHRDLKPDNIVIQQIGQGSGFLNVPLPGGEEQVKVLDFGIAKLRERADGSNAAGIDSQAFEKPLTEAGLIIGTPQYMSPEQCRARELDARSDVYSLGVILYELLCGELPFSGGTQMEIVIRQVKEPPRPLHQINPEISPALEAVVLDALSKDPDLRPPSAAVLAERLKQALNRPSDSTSTRPSSRAESAPAPTVQETPAESVGNKNAPRNIRLLRGAAILVGVLLVIVLGTIGWQLTGKKPTADPSATTAGASSPPAGMMLISGGKFVMGRNDGAKDKDNDYEGPAHEVEVKPFCLDIHEVTNRQYQEFVASTGYPAPRHWIYNGAYAPEEENHPVTHVNWVDAAAFARWKGKRLPTEAEWEYAARGGDQQFIYPWGNTFTPGDANFVTEGRKSTAPVGSFPKDRSRFGIFDLAGNISEWVQDIYQPYDAKAERLWRVFRGGNFTESPNYGTATYRFWDLPTPPDRGDRKRYDDYLNQMNRIGFRCAKDPSAK